MEPLFHLFHHPNNNPFHCYPQPQMHHYPILFFLFASLSLLSLTFLSFSLYKRFSKTPKHVLTHHNPETVAAAGPFRPDPNSPTHLARSVLLEALPPDSAKWVSLFGDPDGTGEEQRAKRRKRKKAKKIMDSSGAEEREKTGSDSGFGFESGCLYPFTSSSSAMQRKIKQQYDELVKSNESKKLTLPQQKMLFLWWFPVYILRLDDVFILRIMVVQFANSLINARNELQNKADVIQRKFVITKALLCKADRSSFDRLHQQIYKLELEQKRLEEDAFVYNLLQQQLKLSPAYQKMLELGACMEKAKQCGSEENSDDEFTDISFEELLAQEKKDSFWQKNGKSRTCSS